MMPSNQTPHDDSVCGSYIYMKDIVSVLYLLMFPIALLLNSVAVWVALHLKSTSTFVVYLKNLVAADFTLTIIIPIKVASDLPGVSHILFALTCNFFGVIFYSTQYTCITLLGLISLDRFFKIMLPQSKLLSHNLTFAKVLCGSVWVLLFGGSALPNILSKQSVANMTKPTSCMKFKGPVGLEVHGAVVIFLNILFWLVSLVVAVCYICIVNKVIQSFRNSGSNNNQGNRKIKLHVFLVVIVFFVLFTPYHIIRIPYTFQQVTNSKSVCPYTKGKFIKELSLWLVSTNICVDPLLYVFLCREFKEKLVSMVKKIPVIFKVASAAKAAAAPTQSE